MAVTFIFFAILALAAAQQPEYCKLPDDTQEVEQAADTCAEPGVPEECFGHCLTKELDVTDADGWIVPSALMDTIFVGEEYEVSKGYFTALAELCVEKGREIDEVLNFGDCDRVNYVMGCIALLLPEECSDFDDSAEEELQKRKK